MRFFSILASVTFLSVANACMKFEHNEVTVPSANPMDDWVEVDGSETLTNYCDPGGSNNCCQPNTLNDSTKLPCANDWNLEATYKICPNSCNGNNACTRIAERAASGSTIEVGNGACSANFSPCYALQRFNTELVNVIIPGGKCVTNTGCKQCGRDSTFAGIFVTTEECCGVATGETNAANDFYDRACFGSDAPSDVPSDVPSDIPSGE